MFISCLNQKGGSGKTTLALHMACAVAERGQKTLLIDADPQASTMAWLACRIQHGNTCPARLTIMAISNGTITDQLPELLRTYDIVVIDAPPRGDKIARDVILASDLVLVPTQLSGFDVWAGDSITRTIEELRPIQRMAAKPPLDWFYVINKKDPRTLAGKAILRSLEKSGQPIFESHICTRACYVESTSQGLTILETQPTDSRARREIDALVDEMQSHINRRRNERAAA